jgi:hypothetical protein
MYIPINATLDEQERRAFIEGRVQVAAVLAHAADGALFADETENSAQELQDALESATRRLNATEEMIQAVGRALRESRFLRKQHATALAATLDALCNCSDDISVADAEASIERACGLRT